MTNWTRYLFSIEKKLPVIIVLDRFAIDVKEVTSISNDATQSTSLLIVRSPLVTENGVFVIVTDIQ